MVYILYYIIRKIINTMEPFECPICLDETTNNLYLGTCNHTICKDCMSQLIKVGAYVYIKCPICGGISYDAFDEYNNKQIFTSLFNIQINDSDDDSEDDDYIDSENEYIDSDNSEDESEDDSEDESEDDYIDSDNSEDNSEDDLKMNQKMNQKTMICNK